MRRPQAPTSTSLRTRNCSAPGRGHTLTNRGALAELKDSRCPPEQWSDAQEAPCWSQPEKTQQCVQGRRGALHPTSSPCAQGVWHTRLHDVTPEASADLTVLPSGSAPAACAHHQERCSATSLTRAQPSSN